MLVSDSWVVDGGRVVGLTDHVERFARGVAGAGGDAATAAEFLLHAARATPGEGRWFPRVDFLEGGEFRRVERPASAPWESAALWTSPVDPRTQPWTKGPDIAAGRALRRAAARRGADEAVIVSGGTLADSAFSALAWWQGTTLCHVPDDVPRVDSTTLRWVRAEAARRGVSVVAERCRPADLAGCEVWMLNVSVGICPARTWVGGPPLRQPDPTRLRAWRASYAAARA